MAALDTLTIEVSESKTVMASAATLLGGLKARLDEAIAANQGGDNGAALTALAADLDASTNDLAAAVTANTPAESADPEDQTDPTQPTA